MNKTSRKTMQLSNRLTANTDSLSEYLDCGRATAVKIGEAAGAKIQIGKRVLWNMSKVQSYLDSLSVDDRRFT
jgi:hypothetical protein